MPASPALGERLSPRVVAPLREWELTVIQALADLVRAHVEHQEWSAARRLAELSAMLHRVRLSGRDVSRETAAEIKAVLSEARTSGARQALDDLRAAEVDGVPRSPSVPVGPPRAAGSLVILSRRAVEQVPRLLSAAYSRAVAAGALETLDGERRITASQHVLDRLVSDGVRGFTDSAGRSWALDTYVEMATRTVAGQTAIDAHTEQLQKLGHDLVLVSDAPRECELCRPWEGRVLSISGATARGTHEMASEVSRETVTVTVDGSLAEARAAGLQHPNCRHNTGAYVPGAVTSQPRKAEPKGYEAQQRQRAIERKIREWKRREAAAMTEGSRLQARAKVKEWQRAMRDHLAENPYLKRQSSREQIGKAH